MNLKNASICLDCDEIFILAGSGGRCPVCASRASAPIARWVVSLPLPGEAKIREKILEKVRAGIVQIIHEAA